MQIKLGTAPDSWGVWHAHDPKQIPWQRYLDEVAQVGYRWTEIGPYGYMSTDASVLREELAKRSLSPVASAIEGHALGDPAAWSALETHLLQMGELLAALRAPYMFLIDESYASPAAAQYDARGWQQLIETTHRAADIVGEHFGLQMLFHPHAETRIETEDQIEKFLADTDAARVNLCFDTGHHAYRGGDPVAFMRKHHARIPFLHLKSVDREMQQRTAREGWTFGEAVANGVFCEPSQGAVDFVAFRDVLRDVDYDGYAIVEQDMYPAPFDKPLPIARRTHDYLRSIGIG